MFLVNVSTSHPHGAMRMTRVSVTNVSYRVKLPEREPLPFHVIMQPCNSWVYSRQHHAIYLWLPYIYIIITKGHCYIPRTNLVLLMMLKTCSSSCPCTRWLWRGLPIRERWQQMVTSLPYIGEYPHIIPWSYCIVETAMFEKFGSLINMDKIYRFINLVTW